MQIEMNKKLKKQCLYQAKQTLKQRLKRQGHSIVVKGSIQEEGITVVNNYAPNRGGPK